MTLNPTNTSTDTPTPKYYRFKYKGILLDPYRIIVQYPNIKHPAHQHAIKKLLRAGESVKDLKQDIDEVIGSLQRWKQMIEEDEAEAKEKSEKLRFGDSKVLTQSILDNFRKMVDLDGPAAVGGLIPKGMMQPLFSGMPLYTSKHIPANTAYMFKRPLTDPLYYSGKMAMPETVVTVRGLPEKEEPGATNRLLPVEDKVVVEEGAEGLKEAKDCLDCGQCAEENLDDCTHAGGQPRSRTSLTIVRESETEAEPEGCTKDLGCMGECSLCPHRPEREE